MTRDPRSIPAIAALVLASVVIARADHHVQQAQSSPLGVAFPEAAGRATVERVCRDCHPAGDLLRRKETRFRWSVIVDQMIGEGAKIADDEFDVIVSYLSVALGKKIKINEAPAEAIAETFDISEELAAAIVKHRTERGGFKDWKDIASTPGVDAKRIEEQRNNLDFGG